MSDEGPAPTPRDTSGGGLPVKLPSLPNLRVIDSKTSPGARIFANAGLQEQIDRALQSVASDRRAAVIDVGADEKGIVAVAVVKLNEEWSIMGALEHRYAGEWSGRIGVRWVGK